MTPTNDIHIADFLDWAGRLAPGAITPGTPAALRDAAGPRTIAGISLVRYRTGGPRGLRANVTYQGDGRADTVPLGAAEIVAMGYGSTGTDDTDKSRFQTPANPGGKRKPTGGTKPPGKAKPGKGKKK